MSETAGSHQIEARQPLAQGELPSLSLITSLPGYSRSKGEWKGKIQLNDHPAEVTVSLSDESDLPIYGGIDVREGTGHEEWTLVERRDSLDLQLKKEGSATILIPDIAEPEQYPSGVSVKIVFKKPHSKKQPLTVDNVNYSKSTVTGEGTHSIPNVVRQLTEMASALKQAA